MRQHKVIGARTAALRKQHFPDMGDEELWQHAKYPGFTPVPRTMPIIMNIIDDLTKGKPASMTYFSLWCKSFEEMYVNLSSAEDLAFYSGFTGQRAVRTWRERMESLARLGFVKTAPGPRGGMSHAAIPNPHFVIRRLHRDGCPGLTEAAYGTLVDRAAEIGAADMCVLELPEEKKQSDESS